MCTCVSRPFPWRPIRDQTRPAAGRPNPPLICSRFPPGFRADKSVQISRCAFLTATLPRKYSRVSPHTYYYRRRNTPRKPWRPAEKYPNRVGLGQNICLLKYSTINFLFQTFDYCQHEVLVVSLAKNT